MDRSERNARFFKALKNRDEKILNKEFGGVRLALIQYLMITCGAGKAMAEDCVSVAFLKVIGAIDENRIRDENAIFSYLRNTCWTVYRDELRKRRASGLEENNFDEDEYLQPEDQIKLLLNEERKRILEICIELLPTVRKKTITYFIDNPEVSLQDASEELQVSYVNLRKLKSRIIHQLHDCVQSRLNKGNHSA